MQREILFKAKRKDNGQWVIGLPRYMNYKRLKNGTMFVDGIEDQEGYVWEVDPETVCQYTGKKDVTELKIFESDLVQDDHGQVFEVRYNDFCAFMLYPIENEEHFIAIYPGISLRVIGNIHDKKEGQNE